MATFDAEGSASYIVPLELRKQQTYSDLVSIVTDAIWNGKPATITVDGENWEVHQTLQHLPEIPSFEVNVDTSALAAGITQAAQEYEEKYGPDATLGEIAKAEEEEEDN